MIFEICKTFLCFILQKIKENRNSYLCNMSHEREQEMKKLKECYENNNFVLGLSNESR